MRWRREGVKARRHGSAEPEAKPPSSDQPQSAAESCSCAHSGLPSLQDLAGDWHEALAISLIRFVFAGYCSGKVDAWDQGFEAAAGALGHDGGSMFFSRVLSLGRAVKAERHGNFNFMPGHCSRISEDEMELLAALQAARHHDPRPLDQALFVLARHVEAERLHAALRGMANLIDMMADEADAASPSHPPTSTPAGTVLH
jgi:hypothetical protein